MRPEVTAAWASKRTEMPATVGLEVDNTSLTVRVDETGAHITLNVIDEQPETALRTEPLVVLGLA